jgi:hypothetical protein
VTISAEYVGFEPGNRGKTLTTDVEHDGIPRDCVLTEFVMLRRVVSLRDERSDVEKMFWFGCIYYVITQ